VKWTAVSSDWMDTNSRIQLLHCRL
jgi:hypothetical protein